MLELNGLHKSFNKGTTYEKKLFSDLSLNVKKGEFVTVIGSNGAGKSTLFKLMTNEMPLDHGQIFLSGEEISGQRTFELAKSIARVVQDPKLGTLGDMTVWENLSMASLKGKKIGLRSCKNQEMIKYYKDLLEPLGLGLENKMEVPTKRLSGGQRQALTLIMSTLSDPEMILLDEHTAALDPITSQKVMEMTKKLIDQRGLTCLMITHKIQDAIDYGNRLIMLSEGRVLLDIGEDEKKELTLERLMQRFKEMKATVSDCQLF